MFVNLFYGLLVMGLCLLMQSLLIVTALQYYMHRQTKMIKTSFWSSIVFVNGVMVMLVIGNIIQVAIWAALFLFLGEFSEFGEAVYHSAVNFATLGYGDIVMSAKYKLLGPLEAINGVLMIGMSTAALMAAFQDAIKKLTRARQTNPDPEIWPRHWLTGDASQLSTAEIRQLL